MNLGINTKRPVPRCSIDNLLKDNKETVRAGRQKEFSYHQWLPSPQKLWRQWGDMPEGLEEENLPVNNSTFSKAIIQK